MYPINFSQKKIVYYFRRNLIINPEDILIRILSITVLNVPGESKKQRPNAGLISYFFAMKLLLVQLRLET